jgi:hypothetical protein
MHSTYLNHCMIFDTTKEAVNRQKQKHDGIQVFQSNGALMILIHLTTGACYDFFDPSTTLKNHKGGISNVKISYNTFLK